MSVYMPHMNSLHSRVSPQVLVYIHFKLLAHALNKYASLIAYICLTALHL